MFHSNISATLSAQDVADVKSSIAAIGKKMPFLITLTQKEKGSIIKLGPKSVDFASDAANAATSFPDILPPSFNGEEFQKDSALFATLNEIALELDALQEKVNDTLIAVGSEAMSEALEVYAYVQTAAPKKPGMKSVAEKLKARFKKTSATRKKEAA